MTIWAGTSLDMLVKPAGEKSVSKFGRQSDEELTMLVKHEIRRGSRDEQNIHATSISLSLPMMRTYQRCP